MSLMWNDTMACPVCGAEMHYEVAASINADRRSDLKAEILANTYQTNVCGSCNTAFRIQPEFTYLETGRGQLIHTLPVERIRYWQDFEQVALDIYEENFGDTAPAPAQQIGAGLEVRVAFGWAGLREKLLCREHGIDDAALEALKLSMLRAGEISNITDDRDLRLHGVADGKLLIGWFEDDADEPVETMLVPRALYDELAGSDWAELRRELTAGPFVDINRMLVEDVLVDVD